MKSAEIIELLATEIREIAKAISEACAAGAWDMVPGLVAAQVQAIQTRQLNGG